jgi:predicted ABC-type ATPase
MSHPELWIVAGPNGAGKTTCVQREPISAILPNIPFLNPDDKTLQKLKTHGYSGFRDTPLDLQTRLFFESADEVHAELERAIAAHRPVGVETVLSSNKYRSLVEAVNAANGFVRLIKLPIN